VIAVFPDTDDARVLIQGQRKFGFAGQTSAFDNQLWTKFYYWFGHDLIVGHITKTRPTTATFSGGPSRKALG
jgi:hypothetical protein